MSLTPAAVRELASLSGPAQRRMIRQLEQLSSEPRREGVKKLQGSAGLYRMHAGKDYVVVYQIDDARRGSSGTEPEFAICGGLSTRF